MYDVNQDRIEQRLEFISPLCEGIEQIEQMNNGEMCFAFAQERAILLAIEVVTDVASDLIDGFMMREAASYDDLITVITDEGVISRQLGDAFTAWVQRRDLYMRQYVELERGQLEPIAEPLTNQLKQFADAVRSYLAKELW